MVVIGFDPRSCCAAPFASEAGDDLVDNGKRAVLAVDSRSP